MCDSDNFHEEKNVRDHFEWHLADKKRRLTQGLAKREEHPYSPLSNRKKQKNNMKYCFE